MILYVVEEAWHSVVKYSAGNGFFNGYDSATFWQNATEEQLTVSDAECAGHSGKKCSRPYKHLLMPKLMQSDLVKQVGHFFS